MHFVVKLLSPPIPTNIQESGSHLFGYMSMLNSILVGACCIDVVHIISLYGMVGCLSSFAFFITCSVVFHSYVNILSFTL